MSKIKPKYIETDVDNRFVSDTEKSTWNSKQEALISGTNIKTVNGESILGSGNLAISGGMGDIPSNTLVGRNDSGTGGAEALSVDESKVLLNLKQPIFATPTDVYLVFMPEPVLDGICYKLPESITLVDGQLYRFFYPNTIGVEPMASLPFISSYDEMTFYGIGLKDVNEAMTDSVKNPIIGGAIYIYQENSYYAPYNMYFGFYNIAESELFQLDNITIGGGIRQTELSGSLYTEESVAYNIETLTNPTTCVFTDGFTDDIILEFPLFVGDLAITSLKADINGNIHFSHINDISDYNIALYMFSSGSLIAITGSVQYELKGDVPNRHLIIQYTDVLASYSATPITFQIKLYENSDIEVHMPALTISDVYMHGILVKEDASSIVSSEDEVVIMTAFYFLDTLSVNTASKLAYKPMLVSSSTGDCVISNTLYVNKIVSPSLNNNSGEIKVKTTNIYGQYIEYIGVTSDYEYYICNDIDSTLSIYMSSSSFSDGVKLMFRFKDAGTSINLSWSSDFVPIGVDLPITTVPNKYLYVGCIYSKIDDAMHVIAVAQEE